jgi:MbtH protein
MIEENEDSRTYSVVVNHEEQYSTWPTGRPVPSGWNEVGVTGSKQECLAHIERVWTDIRPLSVKKRMAELNAQAKSA